ncbi:hypothetical protein MLD38_027572 [Melastoma candidum]|uniref:Uncharacterized protein n=1 Tax=Melastoma candidum TaxID=119954 RepID=A0ACB9P4V3_9MYRT|nr:hypothetical protein MLD38_027572 [Melastoma candidum]
MATNFLFPTFAALLVLTACIAWASARPPLDELSQQHHEGWMHTYGRVYTDEGEKQRRSQIFNDNVKFIQEFNRRNDVSYKLAVNKFADLTKEEFLATYANLKVDARPSSSSHTNRFRYENFTAIPKSLDWRSKGVVAPIRDQGTCGACWAFSAVAAIEGITKIKTGKLTPLSVQQLVDCDHSNSGCSGGLMSPAFEYVQGNGGLVAEDTYPYNAEDGTCNVRGRPVAKVTGYEQVTRNDEKALLKAVANQPVSIGVDANGFQFYSGGVFDGPCDTYLNHAITAVGYGTVGGKKYWLMKNSWGEDWGEDGYLKIERDVESETGLCGIAMDASYPTA